MLVEAAIGIATDIPKRPPRFGSTPALLLLLPVWKQEAVEEYRHPSVHLDRNVILTIGIKEKLRDVLFVHLRYRTNQRIPHVIFVVFVSRLRVLAQIVIGKSQVNAIRVHVPQINWIHPDIFRKSIELLRALLVLSRGA